MEGERVEKDISGRRENENASSEREREREKRDLLGRVGVGSDDADIGVDCKSDRFEAGVRSEALKARGADEAGKNNEER